MASESCSLAEEQQSEFNHSLADSCSYLKSAPKFTDNYDNNNTNDFEEKQWEKRIRQKSIKKLWTADEETKLFDWIKEDSSEDLVETKMGAQRSQEDLTSEKLLLLNDAEGKKRKWTKQEDNLIFKLCKKYGPAWEKIAELIPGRTQDAIRNRFFLVRKLFRVMNKKENNQYKIQNFGTGNRQEEINLNSKHSGSDTNQLGLLKGKQNGKNKELNFEEKSKEIFSNANRSPIFEEISNKEIPLEGSFSISKKLKISQVETKILTGGQIPQIYEYTKNLGNKSDSSALESAKSIEFQNSQRLHQQDIQSQPQSINYYMNNVTFLPPKNLLKISSQQGHNNFDFFHNNLNSFTEKPQYKNKGQRLPHPTQNISKSLTQQSNLMIPFNIHQKAADIATADFKSYSSPEKSLINCMLMIALDFSEILIKECFSKNVDDINHLSNLVKLLQKFAEHNDKNLVANLQLSLPNKAKNRTFDEGVLENFIQKTLEAVNCVSAAHSYYSRKFMEIFKDPRKIELGYANNQFIVNHLASLQNLVFKIKNQTILIKEACLFEDRVFLTPKGYIEMGDPHNYYIVKDLGFEEKLNKTAIRNIDPNNIEEMPRRVFLC